MRRASAADFLERCRSAGVAVFGAITAITERFDCVDYPKRIALVLSSKRERLSDALWSRIERKITILMRGRVLPQRCRRREHPALLCARQPQPFPRRYISNDSRPSQERKMMERNKVIRRITDLPDLGQDEAIALEHVTRQFEFRVPSYYARLIDWKDPNDPLRKIILPNAEELLSDLDLDASVEADNTVMNGLQHKYGPTALLLVNDICAAYCRFCFRKRFTLSTSAEHHIIPAEQIGQYEKETNFEVAEAVKYIAAHPEINNVLITGGDPLMLSSNRLEMIVRSLRQLPHVKIIRIGSKVPAFDPNSVTDETLDMLASYSGAEGRLYLMVHFNHPRELTDGAWRLLDRVMTRGIVVSNQTPLLRGVNDDPDTLARLLERLADGGVVPHYVFHCRPTRGNEPYMLTLQEGFRIVSAARSRLSGLAMRFRYVASHATGKIEIVGNLGDSLVFRYHEAKQPQDEDRVFSLPAKLPAYWFDTVPELSAALPMEEPVP